MSIHDTIENVKAKIQDKEEHDCGGGKQPKANEIELLHGIFQHFQPVWLVQLLRDVQ